MSKPPQDGRAALAGIFAVMRDPSLKAEEKVLWALYRSYERRDRGAYCGAETLAEHMDTTTRSIERYRASLLRDEDGGSRGYLEMTFRGPSPAEYRACVPSKAPTVVSEQEPQSPDKAVGASGESPDRSSDRSSDSFVGQVRGVREDKNTDGASQDGQNRRDAYPDSFQRAWAAYPKRAGGNPKKTAYRCWRARVREGASEDELERGVVRYAAYCDATGKSGTEYVKQASTFLGPDEHWREDWAVPSKSGGAPEPPLADLQALP
jgi:hypothetical protein